MSSKVQEQCEEEVTYPLILTSGTARLRSRGSRRSSQAVLIFPCEKNEWGNKHNLQSHGVNYWVAGWTFRRIDLHAVQGLDRTGSNKLTKRKTYLESDLFWLTNHQWCVYAVSFQNFADTVMKELTNCFCFTKWRLDFLIDSFKSYIGSSHFLVKLYWFLLGFTDSLWSHIDSCRFLICPYWVLFILVNSTRSFCLSHFDFDGVNLIPHLPNLESWWFHFAPTNMLIDCYVFHIKSYWF